jgi:hypothetical protein
MTLFVPTVRAECLTLNLISYNFVILVFDFFHCRLNPGDGLLPPAGRAFALTLAGTTTGIHPPTCLVYAAYSPMLNGYYSRYNNLAT